jgi:hypothetical protein
MTRELWIALIDIGGSMAIYFTAKYLAPDIAEDVKFVIGLAQPFVLAVIARVYAETLAVKISARMTRR